MTPSHNHNPIARGVPPSSPRSSDRPAGELFLPALRPVAIIHNQERQRSSGTALGLRWGMYRTTCAVGTTGRRSMGGLGSTGRGCTCPGIFLRADGRDGNPFLANIQSKQRGRYAA